MRPWLQESASIQPRTSPGKSDVERSLSRAESLERTCARSYGDRASRLVRAPLVRRRRCAGSWTDAKQRQALNGGLKAQDYTDSKNGAAQPRHITLSRARSRLDRSRFLQPRPHFAAFFEIYKKIIFSQAHFLQNFKMYEFYEVPKDHSLDLEKS